MEQKFYICKHCGNIIAKVKDTGVPVICCGEPMSEENQINGFWCLQTTMLGCTAFGKTWLHKLQTV